MHQLSFRGGSDPSSTTVRQVSGRKRKRGMKKSMEKTKRNQNIPMARC